MPAQRQLGVVKRPVRGDDDAEGRIRTGPPNTVLEAVEVKFVAMVYTDKRGRATPTKIGVMVGDTFFEDPGGDQWAQSLNHLMDWVKRGVEEKLAKRRSAVEGTAPTEDKVDVLGEAM